MVNKLNKNFLINFLIILSIFALDRFSKIYVIFQNEKSLSTLLFESKYLNINLIWNEGIAFGLFSSKNELIYNSISILILVIIIILLIFLINSKNFKRLTYAIIIGGALGNFLDRVLYKSVPDFIDVHYNDFHWFVFNFADIFISIGVFCLIFDEVFMEKIKNEKSI